MVIADEVYEFITFDGHQHLSICGVEALRNRSVVLSSFGKTLHTTGWKVGYALAAPELSAEIRKVHQFSVFATSTPFQHAIASYIEDRSDEVWNLKHFYQAKRDLFLSLMQGSRFEPLPAAGAYFQLMRYGRISDLSDTEFSLWLTRTQGVACIPVSVFYAEGRDEGVVRFCFAKENATLEAAAQRLKSL
jgi:methionine aminotransferase